MVVMLMMKGHPCTSKSTISTRLARQLRWPIIDKDDAKDVLMASPLCSLEQDANALSYSIMFRAAEAQLRCGMSVIIDCPLAYVELYHRALVIASRCSATIVVVECVCKDRALWRARLAARATSDVDTDRAHKPQTFEEIEALLQRYAGGDAWVKVAGPDLKAMVVDTSQLSPAQGCEAALRFLADCKLLQDFDRLPPDDPVFLTSG